MPPRVKRKLTFYTWVDATKRMPFDRFEAAKCVDSLSGSDRVFEEEGKLYAVDLASEGSSSAPTRFRLFRLRDYDNRPLLFKPGVDPKAVSHALDEFTSDVTHISIWDDGYAAYDAHSNAPGPVRLAIYLRRKCDQKVLFNVLLNRDLIDRLKALDDLKTISLSISRTEKAQEAIDSGKHLFDGFSGLLRGGADGMSFQTKMSGGRKHLDPQYQRDVIALAPNAEKYFDALEVSGTLPSGERDSINLLKEKLHVDVELARSSAGGNWPDSNKCFAALATAKRKLEKNGALKDAIRSGQTGS